MDEFDESMAEYRQKRLESEERLRNYLEGRDEAKALYTSFGYSERFDTKSAEILLALKSLVTAKITDLEGFSKYRDRLIDIKNKYDEDPDAYESLILDQDSNYQFLSGNDYDFIDSIEKAGKDNHDAYVKIICDTENHYFLYPLPFGFYDIVYKYKDASKAKNLFDDLISLYKYTYIIASNDRDNAISLINDFKDSITDEYGKRGNTYIDDLIEIRHGSLFSDESGREKKEELDDILNFALETHSNFKDTNPAYVEHMKSEIAYETDKYIKAEWTHTKDITNLVMLNLLDTLYLMLKFYQELATKIKSNSSTSIILVILWGVIIALSYFDYNWASWILAAFTIKYWISASTKDKESSSEAEINLEQFNKLDVIRREINSGVYNSDIIANRLKSLEDEGLYIHSHIYTLLNLNYEKQ